MDKEGVITKLNESLLTEEELALGPEGWQQFEDPFDRPADEDDEDYDDDDDEGYDDEEDDHEEDEDDDGKTV